MYDLDRIREAVTMREALAHYGITMERGGFAPCPFHNDRHPSMKVYPGDRGYYCFVCHEGGDVLHFIQKMENSSFGEAVRVAATIGGIEECRKTMKMRQREDSRRERQLLERRYAQIHAQWVRATDRIHFLTDLASCFTDWTETLASILREREDMTRLAERLLERLTEYERAGITLKPDGV